MTRPATGISIGAITRSRRVAVGLGVAGGPVGPRVHGPFEGGEGAQDQAGDEEDRC